MRTRAAILEARDRPLRIAEVELADPGPGEVRVRIEACGICRSDLHAIDGAEDVQLPAVLGHEACGVLEALGEGCRGLSIGDRVILSWTPACGQCGPCRRGDVQLCRRLVMSTGGEGPMTLDGKGVDRFMALGAFSEHVVVPEAMAVPIRGEIPSEHACLIGCAGMTGFGAAAKTAGVQPGETVAVLGCGGVGLAAVQGARVAGAGRILAVDPLAKRREVALGVGATEALDAEAVVETVLGLTRGGVDVAIECVGSTDVMRDAYLMLRPGGRAVVAGLPGLRDQLVLPAVLLLTERSIKGSIYGSADPAVDFARLVELYDRHELDLAALTGRTRPLDEVNEGIAEMREGRTTRVVLTF